MGGKACVMTNDTGASVAIARLDITVELSERDSPMKCVVHAASGETFTILKEALVMLILGQHRLTTWVFITISSMILVGDLTSCMSTMHQWT
jgi:hypothetical protein